MFCAWTQRGRYVGRNAYTPFSTIHSFRYLCLRRYRDPAPRLVRALSYYTIIAARILNQIFRLLFGLRRANPISTRAELGCLGLDGILWLGKITTTIRLSRFYVMADRLVSFSARGLSGNVRR